MKITIVTYALQIGGVETVIKNLGGYFKKQGHQVTIFETRSVGSWSETFRDQGFDVQSVLANYFESRRQHARRLARILQDFDAILLNDAPFGQAVLGCLDETTTVIPMLHSSLTTMVRNATANAKNWDMLVAVSPAVLESVVQFGIERDSVICIPNGVPVTCNWPKASKHLDSSGPLKVVYLGAVDHRQKGVFHLPGILRNALAQDANVQLDVIGDGEDFDELKARFAAEIECQNVVLHGSMDNVKAAGILTNADVLVMPSYFEGLPIVMLEAMSAGVVPVVSSLPGCTDFVLSQGQDGVLVEKGDEEGFSDAIIALDRDRLLLRRLSEQAWKTAARRFNAEHMGHAYLKLIESTRARRLAGNTPARSGKIDTTLLGDLPWLPLPFVRPVRKILRMLGVFPHPSVEPLLVETP